MIFQLSKGDFLEPFVEFFIKLFFKAGAKHTHEPNELDFWDIFLGIIILLLISSLLYQLYKKIKKQH